MSATPRVETVAVQGTTLRPAPAPPARVLGGAAHGSASLTAYFRLARAGDSTIAIVSLVGAFLATNLGTMPAGLHEFLEIRLTIRNVLLLAGFIVLWQFLCERVGLYDPRRLRRLSDEVPRVLLVCTIGTAAAMIFPLVSRTGAFGIEAVLYFGAAAVVGLLLLRAVLRTVTETAALPIREILIVGSGPRAERAALELDRNADRYYRLLGFVDEDNLSAGETTRQRWAGSLGELEAILMRHPVDEVLIALPIRSKYVEIQRVIEVCGRVGVRCRYLADVFDHGRARPRLEQSERFSTIATPVAPEDGRLIVKRAVDLVGATIGLILIAPVVVVAAVAIKATSNGPVLYVQERHGLHRRRFRMYKLRTMVEDAESRQGELEASNEASGPVFKIREDPRVTLVGRLLRRTALDEVPQLWNVLRGDMSLVGPRPLPIRDVGRFTAGELMRRFSVRPGLTGLWQVRRESTLLFEDWVRLDMQYIDEWSLALDFRILANTLPAVWRGSGMA